MCTDSIAGEFGGQVEGDRGGISSPGLITFAGLRVSVMAEDCLFAQPIECLLWRKQTLRIEISGATDGLQETFSKIIIMF